MRIVAYAALAVALAWIQGEGQTVNRQDALREKSVFATNRCFSKGGLGIVNTSLYIAVKAAKNELRFGEKETWSGLEASQSEVVIFFEGKVWMQSSLPKGFDLSKAVVISFEGEKIRFFDFQSMSGGYYERISH